MVKRKPTFASVDNRGKHLQLATGEWKQLNYIEIFAGKERGGHMHKFNRELFFVVEGKIGLTVNGNRHVMSAGEVFEIPLYMVHTIAGLAKVSKIVVLHTQVFDKKKPDIHVWGGNGKDE